MIKIVSLEVRNFKSLYNTKIEEFKGVNFFFGYNNSGKSNIFKFLKLLFDRKSQGTKVNVTVEHEGRKSAGSSLVNLVNFYSGYILNEPYLFSKDNRDVAIDFEVVLEVPNKLFPQQKDLKAGKFLTKDNAIVKFVGQIVSEGTENSSLQITKGYINNKLFYKNEDNVDYFFPNKAIGDRKLGEDIMLLFNDLVLLIDSDRNFTKELSTEHVTSFDSKSFKGSLFDLYIRAERNQDFNSLIKFVSDFEFSVDTKAALGGNVKSFPFNKGTDIGFARFGDELEIMLKNAAAKLPLKNYGSGIQQFLYMLAKIHFNKSSIVIIEELELNLSPAYQVELLRFLKSLLGTIYSQLLFSSHSPYFAQKKLAMLDVVHRVRIDYTPAGGTIVDSHTDIDVMDSFSELGFHYFEDV